MQVQIQQTQPQLLYDITTQNDIIDEIIYSNELKFKYINSDKLIKILETKYDSKENIRHIDILKYNYNKIILQIAEYFPDIKIDKFENSPCANECVNFNIDSTYRYDIYLVLTKEDKIYEYGFDFFTSKLDINNHENKYEHSKILLDNYEYFFAEDIDSTNDIKYYLNETLFKLMVAICSINNDEYKLAEILFVKLYEDKMSSKQLLKKLGYFKRIINWKKIDCINIKDLESNLLLINNETEKEIELDEFKKIITNICEKHEIKFNPMQKDINFNIFEKIILHINSNYTSEILDFYKDIYQQTISMLLQSLKLIIQLTNEMNMRKKFISRYINYLIEFKLKDYKNQTIFNKNYLTK